MRVLGWNVRLARGLTPTEYASVVVPLEQAHLHSHSARLGHAEYDEEDEEEAAMLRCGSDAERTAGGAGADADAAKDGEHESTGMLEMRCAEYSIEGLRKEMRKGEKTQWTDYELKSKLINKAIQDIGMGRYNWQLFVLCGFGWFADNLWLQGVSLTLPSLSAEFGISEKTVRYTTSSLYLGLCIGSFAWGVGSDVLGRRLAFNLTLLITAVFGLLAAYASSWGMVCLLFAAMGFGVGGNLPVDGALFLEFLPDASSSLLTLLSVWWPVGQLTSSLFAWFYIANWPVEEGWRHFVFTIGIVTFVMFLVRFGVFRLFESPKFLLSRGRPAEAVAVVQGIAYRNGTKTWLTEEILDAVVGDNEGDMTPAAMSTTANVIMDKLRSFSGERLRPLFRTRRLATATVLVWFCWATIGMGYPLFNAFLPQYLSHGGSEDAAISNPDGGDDATASTPITADTYRSYAITSVLGIPGSLLAAYLVDQPSRFLGRRGTLAGSTLVSAVFLFLFVLLGHSPESRLFFSCVEAFSQNIMYGVLYAFTPEMFPAPVRGAGTGVASFLNRVTGLAAPVLAANFPGDGTSGPVYLSAVLILAAFGGMCLIPIETRGAQRL